MQKGHEKNPILEMENRKKRLLPKQQPFGFEESACDDLCFDHAGDLSQAVQQILQEDRKVHGFR